LLVALDDVGWSSGGVVGICAGVASGASLSKEVPALVEGDLDVLQSCRLIVGPFGAGALEVVFFIDELVDAVEDLGVVHGGLLA
jgi:hypothetical protein